MLIAFMLGCGGATSVNQDPTIPTQEELPGFVSSHSGPVGDRACLLSKDPAICLEFARQNPGHDFYRGALLVACGERFGDSCRLLHEQAVAQGKVTWARLYAEDACDSGDLEMCDKVETYAAMEQFARARPKMLERVKAARAKFGGSP